MTLQMDRLNKKDVEEILKRIVDDKKLSLKIRLHFDEILDEDYVPPKSLKKERYSESEGSAEEEDFTYTTEDEEGFLSLR